MRRRTAHRGPQQAAIPRTRARASCVDVCSCRTEVPAVFVLHQRRINFRRSCRLLRLACALPSPRGYQHMNSEFRPAVRRLVLGATTAVLTVASVATGAAGPAPASGPVPGLQVAFIDHAVVPGDDFFRYANGAWLKV